jgi:UDP-2,3-diacylglucosamine hydrolase
MEGSGNIGVIAGGGQFPRLFIEAAKDSGRKSIVVGFKGETAPEVATAADCFCWVKLGQLGKVIQFFKKNNVAEAVFLGTITKTRIFRDVFFDLKGLSLWRKIDRRHDDAILRAIADTLQDDGITIVESTRYLADLLFPAGVLTRKKPSRQQKEDIVFGWHMAKAIGKLDIGQCVVVRNRAVLSVEAIEGTDAAILRGGKLGKEKVVVVKVHKPGQDFRFDLPATGLQTIESMKAAGAAVLAVEAGKSLMFDSEAVIREADAAGIVVVGITEDENGIIRY